jgi:general secretion pathway protein J
MTRARAFSLLELLVALAVFAALAAAAYGGLASIARTRAALAQQQDRFAAVTRAVSALERDLRQAIARPVLGNGGQMEYALLGDSSSIVLTRLGYANPLAEPRSHLERVVYSSERGTLRRGRYAVLDRAPDSTPSVRDVLERAGDLQVRDLGDDNAWHETWPPRGLPDPVVPIDLSARLPRAVEFRFAPADLGEIRRVVELPSTPPARAANPSGGGQ